MEGEAVEDSIELIGEVVFLSDSHVKVVSLLIDDVGNPVPKFTVEVGDVSNNVAAGVLFIVVVGDDNKDDDDNDDEDDDGNNDDDVDNDDNDVKDNHDDDVNEEDVMAVSRLCCSIVILVSSSELLVYDVVRDGNSWVGVTWNKRKKP